ncbi:MAG: chemotaxis protein CheW [Thermohalobaculum sp.]|nr:chemotaxis protein CheW [Thermohalobaculum sp.]
MIHTLETRPAAPATIAPRGGTFVIFDLFGQTMGVDVRHVREILGLQQIARLPGARPELAGVIDLRGRCVPIVDLGARFGMSQADAGEDARIVVFDIEMADRSCQLGVTADRVRDVAWIEGNRIEPASGQGAAGWDGRGLIGATRRDGKLVFLLDITHFLAPYCDAALTETV